MGGKLEIFEKIMALKRNKFDPINYMLKFSLARKINLICEQLTPFSFYRIISLKYFATEGKPNQAFPRD